jgi:hypothetical protein
MIAWLTAPVRWFGRHSYELYLTYEFLVLLGVMAFLRWHGRDPDPLHIFLGVNLKLSHVLEILRLSARKMHLTKN